MRYPGGSPRTAGRAPRGSNTNLLPLKKAVRNSFGQNARCRSLSNPAMVLIHDARQQTRQALGPHHWAGNPTLAPRMRIPGCGENLVLRSCFPSSSASASDDERGDLMDDTVAKPQWSSLAPRGVVASTRKIDSTNEAASSTLLTPMREQYQKCVANGRVVFAIS
jgi:hypothetical protein